MLKRLLKKIRHPISYTLEEKESVLSFFSQYQGFRLASECSKVTGLSFEKCIAIKEALYEENLLGGYVFAKGQPPQAFMQQEILKRFPDLDETSAILEIGPGANPVFLAQEFPNWVGIDKYLDQDGVIKFRENNWKNQNSGLGRIYNGSWEELSLIQDLKKESFDLVVGSHSFEHVFKPIQTLKEAAKMLKASGILVLFVPNGFSDEPAARLEMTHTLYMVPEMIYEFFQYADCYEDLTIDDFRTNYDFIITAKKRVIPNIS